MDLKYYEENLSKDLKSGIDVEKMWDEKADMFNSPNEKEHSGFSNRVIEILNSKNLIKGKSILDVGGGGGRYAIPFAKHGAFVKMIDISSKMIEYAKNRSDLEKVSIDFEKIIWEDIDVDKTEMKNKFDLVFSSMCPACRTTNGIYNIIKASKNKCLICQMILDTDDFTEYLYSKTGIEREYHPHNDRDSVQNTFNILWLKGFDVTIDYIYDNFEIETSMENIIEKNKKLFDKIENKTSFKRNELINDFFKDKKFNIIKNRTLALLMFNI